MPCLSNTTISGLIFRNVSGLQCLTFSLFAFISNPCQLSLFRCARLSGTPLCLPSAWILGIKSVVSSFTTQQQPYPPLIWFPKHMSSLNQQHRIPQRTSADACADHCLFLAPVHNPAPNKAWRREVPFSPRALLALEPPPLNQKPKDWNYDGLVWGGFVNGHWENSVSGRPCLHWLSNNFEGIFQHMTPSHLDEVIYEECPLGPTLSTSTAFCFPSFHSWLYSCSSPLLALSLDCKFLTYSPLHACSLVPRRGWIKCLCKVGLWLRVCTIL